MGVRVVLVEDNDVFRETLELLLGLRGDIEVVAAVASGQEAVRVCGSLEPDVVLVDYRMPGLNGAQTTAEVLRASPRSRVVCLTASISRAEMESLRDAGAVACLTKDEDLEQIVASIHSAAAAAAA
ncbi:MAG TPA: response regulator transcription factor [Gaiellaceae bacterium]|nr:response regulator transcription factor [Gaiellaceae bacterium]